jgi:hypothetical protein
VRVRKSVEFRRQILGDWPIVEMELWDRDALDLAVPAHMTFGPDELGEIQLIAIEASIDYRVSGMDCHT